MKKVLFIFVVWSIIICGCSIEEGKCSNSGSYPYWTKWSDGKFVSIVSDSLAILSTKKYEVQCEEVFGNEYYTDSKLGLFLINYRVKQKPLKGSILNFDSSVTDLTINENHFADTSVLIFDGNYNYGFWKIGTESVKINKIDVNHFSTYVSPWIDKNKILFRNSVVLHGWDILDTKTGQTKAFEFSGEYEWLFGCNAISYINDKIVCTKVNLDTEKLDLIVNNNTTDTHSINSGYYDIYALGFVNFYGNYIKDIAHKINEDSPYLLSEIYKIDTVNFKFDTTFIPIWIGDNRFYKDTKNLDDFVYYSSEDLIQTGN